jgi:ubiquinone/menaquinone biosynthesis C-methylase UbiE
MERVENLPRLENVGKINISNPDYLVYLSFHRELKAAIQKYAKGKLLDIGCGNKPYESWFEGKIEKYIGCDVVQSSSNKVDVLCLANKIPLEDNHFGTVFSTQTIEHIEDYQGMIEEAYRVLKKDGCFILSGPFYWHLHEEPYDFYRFSKHGFKYILEKAGFEMLDVKENGGAWATLGLMMNHTFGFYNPKANKVVKGLKYIYQKLKLFIFVNRLFRYLDAKDFNSINTINYVVVAIKKK